MSELEDFFRVDSSAPSLSGTPSADNWDFDDFSFDDALPQVHPVSSDAGPAAASEGTSQTIFRPGKGLERPSKQEKVSESPQKRASLGGGGGESIHSFDLVSTPSVEDVKAMAPDVKGQELDLPKIDTAEVDGWDDDSDFFDQLESSQQVNAARVEPNVYSQIPFGSQHSNVGLEKGIRDAPQLASRDNLDQDHSSFIDRIPNSGLAPSSDNHTAGENKEQVSLTEASCNLREVDGCQKMDPLLKPSARSDQAESNYENASAWHASTMQAPNLTHDFGGDASTGWFDSDNILPIQGDPGYVRGTATPELALDSDLGGDAANTPVLDAVEPKPLQLGQSSGELDQSQSNSYLQHSYGILHGADLFWENSEPTVVGTSHTEDHLKPTDGRLSSGSPGLGMNYEAFVSEDAIAFGRSQGADPPHGQEAVYASGQWGPTHLGQTSMSERESEVIQESTSSFFQPNTPNLSTDGAKVDPAGNDAISPVQDEQRASWEYDHSNSNGTSQIISQLSEIHKDASTPDLPDFTEREGAESSPLFSYDPQTISTSQPDVNQATGESAADFWNQDSTVEDMHGFNAQSVEYNPPVAPHGIDTSDDMAFFDQLDVVGGAQPIISAEGALAFWPDKDTAATDHHTSPSPLVTTQQEGLVEPTASGAEDFFGSSAGIAYNSSPLEEQNPPANLDPQYTQYEMYRNDNHPFPQHGIAVSPVPKPIEFIDDVSFFDTLGDNDYEGTAMIGHTEMDKGLLENSRAAVAAYPETLQSANLFCEETTTFSSGQIDDFPCRSSTNSATPSPNWMSTMKFQQVNGVQSQELHIQGQGVADHIESNGRLDKGTFGEEDYVPAAQSSSLYTNGTTQPTSSASFQAYNPTNAYSDQATWGLQQDSSLFNGTGAQNTSYQMPSQMLQPSFMYNSQQQWETPGSSQYYAQPGSYSAQTTPTVPVAPEAAPISQIEPGNWPRHHHGRPACPLISFGVGGRVALMIPKVGAMGTSVGQIELQTVGNLPSILSHRQREAGFAMPPSALDPARAAIERFPGPLGAASTREKLVSFITERMELCSEEEPECQDPDSLRALWGILRMMVKHQGFLVDKNAKANSVANEEFVELISTSNASKKSWVDGGADTIILQDSRDQPQMQNTAADVQKLASLGKITEAITAAKSSGLWEIALVLSQSLGPKAFSETASEMASQRLSHGAPLQTLLHVMSGNAEAALKGVSHEVPFKKESVHQFGADAQGYSMIPPAAEPLLDDWQNNLAMLAANRTPTAMEIANKLGDRLLNERNNVLGAHMCYLIGGCTPQSVDAQSGCKLSLLGWNHNDGLSPNAAAIQRTEIFEWVYGALNPSARIVAFQPYKLQYAWMLADYGKVSEAVHYCELVLEALKSLGNKMPPGLTVCAGSARILLERLQQHAMAHNLTIKRSTTLFESFGRILDKGINRLIGVGDGQGGEEGASRSQSEGWAPSDAASAYRRTTSQASFDSMRNTADEGRQRLSPRPPIAPSSPVPHSPYYNQAMSARWPASSPAPSDPYLPNSASAPGLASVYDEATQYPHSSYSTVQSTSQEKAQKDTTESKGGWLSMLWGGRGKSKGEKAAQGSYGEQATSTSNGNSYHNHGLNNWGPQSAHQFQSYPNAHQVSPASSNWTNVQTAPLGSGPFSFSQNNFNSQHADTLEGSTGAPPTPGAVPGVFPSQSSTPPPPNFFVPSLPGNQPSSVAEFEDVPLE